VPRGVHPHLESAPNGCCCIRLHTVSGQDAWLRLLAAANGNSSRWIRALRRAGEPAAVFELGGPHLDAIGFNSGDRKRLRQASEPPPAWSAWLEHPDHQLIGYGSGGYPQCLAELEDAPLALWADGSHPELLLDPQLAIVGSRHPTANGSTTAEDFAAELSRAGITITSGLARGIDAASHRGALTGPGRTIAVLGNGIDLIYPAANRRLAAEIREAGAVVSEYPPGAGVRAIQFPRRNRIIAGLSTGTLVVEATRRSGSLITARLATESGREVFAVPGSIHSPLSRGCHKLIREGAKLVENIDDILIEIAPQLRHAAAGSAANKRATSDSAWPRELADHLDLAPVSFDQLISATGLTAAELSSMLLHLEMQGKIEALAGGRYCRLIKRA